MFSHYELNVTQIIKAFFKLEQKEKYNFAIIIIVTSSIFRDVTFLPQ